MRIIDLNGEHDRILGSPQWALEIATDPEIQTNWPVLDLRVRNRLWDVSHRYLVAELAAECGVPGMPGPRPGADEVLAWIQAADAVCRRLLAEVGPRDGCVPEALVHILVRLWNHVYSLGQERPELRVEVPVSDLQALLDQEDLSPPDSPVWNGIMDALVADGLLRW